MVRIILIILAFSLGASPAPAVDPVPTTRMLKRQFPNMKFGRGQAHCLKHLAPYIRHLRQSERRFNVRAQKLGIAETTKWRDAAVHWRKRREIWTRASYCWPCFDKSDLVREWRTAPVDLRTARKATAAARTAPRKRRMGTSSDVLTELRRAYAAADIRDAQARRRFYGCLLKRHAE